MAYAGGDILEITYNHPTLGSGVIYPKSGEGFTIDFGGVRADDDEASITGSGESIYKLNNKRWSVEGTVANDTSTRKEYNAIVSMVETSQEAEWTFTHRSGSIFSAKGIPVGDLKTDLNEATFTLKISGGGKIKQIV